MLYEKESGTPLGNGSLHPAGSLLDKDLLTTLQNYRRSVARRYRSLLSDEITASIPAGSMYVSPKIDGELWFLILDQNEAILANPQGKLLTGDIPLVKEATTFAKRAAQRTVFAGELYAVKKDGRPRVGDVSHCLSVGGSTEVKRLAFAAFDVIMGDRDSSEGERGAAETDEYGEKLSFMERILDGGKRVRSVRTDVVSTPDDVTGRFAEWVEGGKAEGLVVRNANHISKIKPSFTLDAAIIGYTVRAEEPDQVRSLALAVMRPGGNFQYVSACGNMSQQQRLEFKDMLEPQVVDSNWRLTRGDGALFKFVAPTCVIEVKATDVYSEEVSGKPIRQMVLSYSEEHGWQALQKMPCASLLFPVFIRIRDDKQVNETDIRIEQVLERCHVSETTDHVRERELPKSEIIRREVYTKQAKNGMTVRKLVVWRTNKDAVDDAFPAYVVHFTDYSPSRKDPLKRVVRRAPDETTATTIAEEMIVSNIKKGWERQDAA